MELSRLKKMFVYCGRKVLLGTTIALSTSCFSGCNFAFHEVEPSLSDDEVDVNEDLEKEADERIVVDQNFFVDREAVQESVQSQYQMAIMNCDHIPSLQAKLVKKLIEQEYLQVAVDAAQYYGIISAVDRCYYEKEVSISLSRPGCNASLNMPVFPFLVSNLDEITRFSVMNFGARDVGLSIFWTLRMKSYLYNDKLMNMLLSRVQDYDELFNCYSDRADQYLDMVYQLEEEYHSQDGKTLTLQ